MSIGAKWQLCIDSVFEDYENKDSDTETTEQKLIELENAVYQALLVKLDAVNDPERKKLIHSKMKEFMAQMNTNSPRITHSEKVLKSMGASDYSKAGDYVEKLFKDRKEENSIKQSKVAKSPRNVDPFTEILDELVKSNPEITTKEVMDRLERLNKMGVIEDIADGEISYVRKNQSSGLVQVSNIPSRISKLRKIYKK